MRGAIDLTRQPTGDGRGSGLSFQFKGITLSTEYPAIAIFVIGLLFFGLAVWNESFQTASITFTGQLEDIPPHEADVWAAVPLIPVASRPDGSIEYTLDIKPHSDTVWAVVVTPGRDPVMNVTYTRLRLSSPLGSSGLADFKRLPVGRPVRTMPPISTIEPARAPLPGLDEQPGWNR
jgi:hypothetical protein